MILLINAVYVGGWHLQLTMGSRRPVIVKIDDFNLFCKPPVIFLPLFIQTVKTDIEEQANYHAFDKELFTLLLIFYIFITSVSLPVKSKEVP